MIRNYIKIAWRTLLKNRTYTGINMIGLSLGITVTLLISLWVWDELTFDQQQANYTRVAQVMLNTEHTGTIQTSKTVAAPLAEALRTNFHQEFKTVALARQTGEHTLGSENKRLRAQGKFIEDDGTKILPLKIKHGIRAGLEKPNSIMLSQEMAYAIFGKVNAIGKTVKVDNNMLTTVTDIYEDFPLNSTFREVKYLLPWKLLVATDGNYKKMERAWEYNWFEVFVELNPATSFSSTTEKISKLQEDQLTKNQEQVATTYSLFLHPMSKWHLYDDWKNGKQAGGQIKYIWLFSIIAGFVLLLATVNFVNLSTASAQKRAKEVGLRKSVGSNRKQLMLQFFCESILTSFLSFLLALITTYVALPYFNELAEKNLSIPYSSLTFHLICFTFVCSVGLFSGAYPALVLSAFKPINTLRGLYQTQRAIVPLRQVFVIVQFTVATILTICTIVVFKQINYAKNRELGYRPDGLISVRINNFNGRNESFRNALLSTGMLTDVAQTTSPATDNWSNTSGFFWEGKPPGFKDDFSLMAVSPEYGETLDWKIIAGRDFSEDFISDSSAVILNESAVRYMNIQDPIGKTIRWKDATFNDASYTIIGVVKDLVAQSPYEPVHQMIYFMQPAANFLIARIAPNVTHQQALTKTNEVFRKHFPHEPFDYSFIKDDFAKKFTVENRIAKLSTAFTLLTLVISCLGVYGLVTFIAEQRKKEISIRKILGAGIRSLTYLLSSEFIKLVLIATAIASPVAWLLLYYWLKNFSLRTPISLSIFIYVTFFMLGIAFISTAFRTIKTAISNPADSLRNE